MVALLTHPHPESPPTVAPCEPAEAPRRSACDPLLSFEGRAGGVAVGTDGSMYVSASGSGVIWRLAPGGETEQFTAGRTPGRADAGPVGLSAPAGVAAVADGSLVVADPGRHRISVVGGDRSVRVLAGGASGYRDGPAAQAMFRHPTDVAVAPDGTCYVADTGNHRIRLIAPDGMVTTLAGSIYDYGDGHGSHGRFRMPAALDVDPDGTCYVADTGNNAVRRITPDGQVTTLAGRPPGGRRDGAGREAGLRWPGGIAVAADGSLWVADFGNGALRHITSGGETLTAFRIAGLGCPTAVAALPDGAVALAGFSAGGLDPARGCLMVHRDAG